MIPHDSPGVRPSGTLLDKAMTLGLWAAIFAFVLAPPFYWDGGVLEGEATLFIRQYLDGRNVAQKVFDPAKNDFSTYQARELSYFVDYLDAQHFRFLFSRGVLLFIPLSLVVAALATVAILHHGVKRAMPRLDARTAKLVLLLYLSSFIYLTTMGVYYRATKPLLAPTLLALMLYTTSTINGSESEASGRRNRWFGGPFFVVLTLSGLMSLWDRQGFIYSVVAFGVLFVYSLSRRRRFDLPLAGAGAVLIGILYNFLVGPMIIRVVNGYWPSFWYQKVPLVSLLRQPRTVAQAFDLLVRDAGMMFGSFPAWAYIAAACFLVAGKFISSPRRPEQAEGSAGFPAGKSGHVGLVAILALMVAGSQILMFALMIVRHPYVYDWEDHRIWYYPLPFLVVLLYGLLMLLDKVMPSLGRRQAAVVNLILLAMIVGNVASWPGYREVMLHSRWFPRVHHQTAALRQSIKEGVARGDLEEEYGRLFELLVRAR